MTENNFKIDCAAVTDRGLSNKRPQNEDALLEMNQIGLFAVADGVGGAQAGDVASQMAVEILAEAFSNLKPNEDAEDLMKLALERANEAIYQMSRDLPQLATMATTIVALHLAGNIATIGHVGDSRLYLLDRNGDLFRKTDDHSVVEEEVRAGRMTIAQAAVHPSRNIISRALGADVVVEVELKTIMFEPNTTFLLCSDGITRHLSDFELRECLVSGDDPEQICQKMKSICFERGAEDNLTAIVARVSDVVLKGDEAAVGSFVSEAEEKTIASFREPETVSAEPANILDLGEEPELPESTESAKHGLAPIELEVTDESQTAGAEEETAPLPAVESALRAEEVPEHFVEEPVDLSTEIPVTADDDGLVPDVESESAEAASAYHAQYHPPAEDVYLPEDESDESDELDELGEAGEYRPSILSFEPSEAIDDDIVTIPIPDDAEVQAVESEPRKKVFDLSEPSGPGLMGKVLNGIFVFLIGAILGAGGLYVFTNSYPAEQAQVPLPAKTENIALMKFEESRRGVDDDPEKYIRQYQSIPDKDVEDLYLLGRANMITGNFAEAKKVLEEAEPRLGEADENNDTVMANDIAAYLAIIANTGAQKMFSEELKKADTADSENAETNRIATQNTVPK